MSGTDSLRTAAASVLSPRALTKVISDMVFHHSAPLWECDTGAARPGGCSGEGCRGQKCVAAAGTKATGANGE